MNEDYRSYDWLDLVQVQVTDSTATTTMFDTRVFVGVARSRPKTTAMPAIDLFSETEVGWLTILDEGHNSALADLWRDSVNDDLIASP